MFNPSESVDPGLDPEAGRRTGVSTTHTLGTARVAVEGVGALVHPVTCSGWSWGALWVRRQAARPNIDLDDLEVDSASSIGLTADRGLVTNDNIEVVEDARCDWLFATRLRRRDDVAAVLAEAAKEEDWVEVEQYGSRVLETVYDDRRSVVVSCGARQRRDTARRVQVIAKIEARLVDLEHRVARGDLVEARKIAAAAAGILARSPVRRLFDVSDVAKGRFVYDYDHDALAYDEALAGHYVLATSLPREVADATQVLAHYRSLQYVKQRLRVLEPALGLRPSDIGPNRGCVAMSRCACWPR